MTMTYPITVSQLSSTSSEKSITEFFSFCGKISNVQYDASTHTAHITFEKEQAARTALMLNGGTLDGAAIHVGSEHINEDHQTTGRPSLDERDHIEQHDKPRAGIVAEMLAKGYILGDGVVNKAIQVDQKQGISTRFLNFIRGLNTSIGQKIGGPDATVTSQAKATIAAGQQRAMTINEQHQITQRVQTFDEQHGLTRQATTYYSKAISSPFGQRVLSFYTETAKQVQDVHEEAKRIAQAEKERQGQGHQGGVDATGNPVVAESSSAPHYTTTTAAPGTAI